MQANKQKLLGPFSRKKTTFFLALSILCPLTKTRASTYYLDTAFAAAFTQPPPVQRQAANLVFSLTPEALVPLGNGRFALLVTETANSFGAGNAPFVAVAVAYLNQNGANWTTENIWYEVGRPGFAGSNKREIRSFGGSPLYFTTTRWCGDDSCSDRINVLALDPSGPQALGQITGGAVYPVDTSAHSLTDCDTTNYTATVGPPAVAGNRFSITYEGWTAPAHGMLPRHSFRRTADVITKGNQLETGLTTPDCMR